MAYEKTKLPRLSGWLSSREWFYLESLKVGIQKLLNGIGIICKFQNIVGRGLVFFSQSD